MKMCFVSAALMTCFLAGGAVAQDYQAIAQELYDQGFENQATIRVRNGGLYVESSGSAGTTERVYSRDGTVLREEETRTSDGTKIEREFDSTGALVEEEIKSAADSKGAVIERTYTEAGTIATEEIITPGGTRIERTYDEAGNVVSNEVSRDRERGNSGKARGRDKDDRDDEAEEDSGDDRDDSDDRGSDDKGSASNGSGGGRDKDNRGGGNGRGRN